MNIVNFFSLRLIFCQVLRFIGSTSRAKIDVIVTEDVTNKVRPLTNKCD